MCIKCVHENPESQWELKNLIFKSLACLSVWQPTEVELQSEDLVEAFPDNGKFKKYLSEKPY
jgi:hypothetical protein